VSESRQPAAPPVLVIGRQTDLALAVASLHDAQAYAGRLLTLIGPPGVGKTTLAFEIVRTLAPRFPDGVYVVRLESLRDPLAVPAAVAAAVGVVEQPGRALVETLAETLRDQQALLLLDNFEQVTAARDIVSRFVESCPRLAVLVTSRAALQLRSEHLQPVEPLALPAVGESPVLEPAQVAAIATVSSVELFRLRAAAVRSGFVLTTETAADVAAICRQLDGLPLAIELAAVRMRALSLREIRAHLAHRLAFLTAGYRDLPERHRTLRAAIAWSYSLLTPEEQRLFRVLGVFATGALIEAIAAVAGDSRGPAIALPSGPTRPELLGVLDTVSGLVDQSVVRREEQPDGASRYTMLQTIREYALEQLTAVGETEAAYRGLADWFLLLHQQIAASAATEGEEHLLSVLHAEVDNLRLLLAWTVQHDPVLGMLIHGRFARFWQLGGLLGEGRRWSERLLAQGADAPAEVRARVLMGTGMFAHAQQDNDAAESYLAEALPLFRELGDEPRVSEVLNALGIVAYQRAQHDAAAAYFEEGLAIGRRMQRHTIMSRCLNNLGLIAFDQSRLQEARAYFQEALAIVRTYLGNADISDQLSNLTDVALRLQDLALARTYVDEAVAVDRRFNNRLHLPRQLGRLAEVLARQGDFAAAQRNATEALTIAEEVGSPATLAEVYLQLSFVAFGQRQLDPARDYARASLRVAHQSGSVRQTGLALARLAQIARAAQEPERAVRLFAAAEMVRDHLQDPGVEEETREVEEYLNALRDRHTELAVQVAWTEGYGLSLEQAVQLALSDADLAPLPRTETTPPASDAPRRDSDRIGLSPRELDVLRLIAAGLSNQDIAEQLVLSERTVEHHASTIYRKIDARTRAAAVAYAIRQGLLDQQP
jgi:predicted ATPase/DNA-binding CsgD family transcriptional regulator